MKEAVSWMEKSWEHGNEDAALFLGKLYEGTIDTAGETDPMPEKARAWFEKRRPKEMGKPWQNWPSSTKGCHRTKDSQKRQTF